MRSGKLILGMCLGAFIALTAHGVQAQMECPTALQDYRMALQSYQDGLFDPAIAGFQTYLQRCPETAQTPQVHYLLGEMLYKQGRFVEALRHAVAAASGGSKSAWHAQAQLLATQSAFQLKQFDTARTYAQGIVAARPASETLPAALYWLGEIAGQQQRPQEALGYYQRVVQLDPGGPYAAYASYALGWLLRERGDVSAALEAFEVFLRRAPTSELAVQTRLVRADLLRQAGRTQEAAAAFKQLVQEAPPALRDEALFWWAEMAYQLGRYAEAQSAYRRLLQEYPDSPRVYASLYGWGWTAVHQQQCLEAVQPWERLLQRDAQTPQALEVHYALAICYLELGEQAAARRHLQQVVAAAETARAQRYEALVQLARLSFRAQHYAEAADYATQALPLAGEEEGRRLHFLLGESYAALGQQEKAGAHWQQVLAGPKTLPVYAYALYRLGGLSMTRGAWQQAIPPLRQLWEEFPDFEERTAVAVQLARAYSNAHQCAEALPLYETSIAASREAKDRQALVQAQTACLFDLGRDDEVVRLLSPLLAQAAPEAMAPVALYTLGQAYMRRQQFDQALAPFALLHQHFAETPVAVEAAFPYALALEKAGRGKEAIAPWTIVLQGRAAGNDDEHMRLQLHVGRLAFKEELFGAALDFLAPARGSSSPAVAVEALFWSGEVYLKQQQWGLAFQVYQELLDNHPTVHPWRDLARLRLGMIYEHQHEWEQALHEYQALLATTTDSELLASARQRIAAIEAGRVLKPQEPLIPSPKG